MAVTKIIGAIHPPKSGGMYTVLKNTINYIINPEKTQDGLYVGSLNCSVDYTLQDMIRTKNYFGQNKNTENNRLGYHYVISWKEDQNISYEMALQITKEFCEEHLKDYEVIYSVHTDKGHVHSHICFNSVNCVDGKKYRYNNGDWAKVIQPITDRLCKKYNCQTLEESTGISLDEYYEEHIKKKKGKNTKGKNDKNASGKSCSNNKYYNEKNAEYSKSDYLRDLIDYLIPNSQNFEDFLRQMKELGFEIKKGKYIAVKGKGMERYRRLKSLGDDYAEEAITRRIAKLCANLAQSRRETHQDLVPAYISYEKFIFVLPLKYRKYAVHEMSKAEKRFYAKMQRLSVENPNVPYPTYKNICKRIKEVKKKEEQLEFIAEHKITNSTDIEILIEKAYKELNDLKQSRKNLYEEKKGNRDLIAVYQELKEFGQEPFLAEGADIYNELFQEDKERYEELQEQFEEYGYGFAEVEDYIQMLGDELRESGKNVHIIKQHISFMKELKEEYQKVEEELCANLAQSNREEEKIDDMIRQSYEEKKRTSYREKKKHNR